MEKTRRKGPNPDWAWTTTAPAAGAGRRTIYVPWSTHTECLALTCWRSLTQFQEALRAFALEAHSVPDPYLSSLGGGSSVQALDSGAWGEPMPDIRKLLLEGGGWWKTKCSLSVGLDGNISTLIPHWAVASWFMYFSWSKSLVRWLLFLGPSLKHGCE